MPNKLLTFLGVTALTLVSQAAVAVDVPGTIACTGFKVEPKTITFYNNSELTIYPIITTSKNDVNEWLQGCFRNADPIPTKFVYKLYVNEDEGIKPGSSATVTLPLYSLVSANRYITWWNGGRVVLADKNVRLKESKDSRLTTPTEVTCQGKNTNGSALACKLSTYSSDVQLPENIYAQLSEYTFGDSILPPVKKGETPKPRLLKPENVGYNISYVDHVYMPVAIGPENNPYIGYSGSAQDLGKFRGSLRTFLNPGSIGQGWPVYNLKLDELRGPNAKFNVKIPGSYNIFAQRFGRLPGTDDVAVKIAGDNPPVLSPLACVVGNCNEVQKKSLFFGASIQRMQNLWGSCVSWGKEDLKGYVTENVNCPTELKAKFEAVQNFFKENHNRYEKMYLSCPFIKEKDADGNIRKDKNGNDIIIPPVAWNYFEALKHIYGWVPFNERCGADVNKLIDTQIAGWTHAQIQSMYINDLQDNYKSTNNNAQLFNPYVELIHGKNYLDMDAYAFSVDDAVGFMSELGSGLIFSVGGTRGLKNDKKFNYADGFSVAIGPPGENFTIPTIKRYGVCVIGKEPNNPKCDNVKQDVEMPTNNQINGFRVGTVASYPVRVRFTDLDDNVYTFTVKEKFAVCPQSVKDPGSQCPTNKSTIKATIACEVKNSSGQDIKKKGGTRNMSSEWCLNANPNQQREKQVTKNYLSFPSPVNYMPL